MKNRERLERAKIYEIIGGSDRRIFERARKEKLREKRASKLEREQEGRKGETIERARGGKIGESQRRKNESQFMDKMK